MIEGRKEERNDAVSKEGGRDEPTSLSNSSALLPYHQPQLRRLGSVRELTLGTGQAVLDADQISSFDP